jgi:preprotein translocase subunit SecA
MRALRDEEFPAKTTQFRERLAQGASLDAILPEAYALVREAARRTLGQRHYDVQLIGGIVLHSGKIAEMKTGEGKTLTATLPLYLNALTGKGAHLVTVNDYLARRDAEWMSPVYTMLGLSVGIIQHSLSDAERAAAYNADVLYGTNNELGFDYLRDNMKFRLEDYVQRALNFAIVDEVDSILIDEARTPLIISGAADESDELYVRANAVVATLSAGTDYEVDEKDRIAQLTETGIDRVEAAFGVNNIFAVEHMKLLHHINVALRAHALFRRDVEYMVRDGEVLIVDEFTGRILPGRRYSDGLHQAIEAKEGVTIERETQTLASITLQNFFRLYTKLAGMTGTAATEAEEFHKVYGLDVVSVPTNRPMVRIDRPDFIYLTKRSKYTSLITDIAERYAKKQPVLIGTVSVESSEEISAVLSRAGIPHEVLNAKNHAREAEIIAHAGEPGRVTVATNMAGRGTDIKLTDASKAVGGLYILGTERNESRRIDNQLRGRAGRQGDVGESRFYVSFEDELIRRFGRDDMKRRAQFLGMKEEDSIESPHFSRTLNTLQEKVERQNFDSRKYLLEYDDVVNQQRIVIYKYRRIILEGAEHVAQLVGDLMSDSVSDCVARAIAGRTVDADAYEELITAIHLLCGIPREELAAAPFNRHDREILTTDLINYLQERYSLMIAPNAGDTNAYNLLHEAQKWVLLETLDYAWKQHMLNLDHLREGIGLRQWGQKNPLIEYKREAFELFENMMHAVRTEIVHRIFHITRAHIDTRAIIAKREQELRVAQYTAPSDTSDGSAVSAAPTGIPDSKVGRNDLCPCGSGKKYKKCCGR